MERKNANKKVEDDKLRINFGTINRESPNTVFYECKTFVTPMFEKDDYEYDINCVKHNLKIGIHESLKKYDIYDNKYIMDLQIPTNGIKTGKKSYMYIQVMLKQKDDNNILPFKKITNYSLPLIHEISGFVKKSLDDHEFEVYKTR